MKSKKSGGRMQSLDKTMTFCYIKSATKVTTDSIIGADS